MKKQIINTEKAPAAIGAYSQAVAIERAKTIYLSGQIPLDRKTMTIVDGGIKEQIHQVFKNLANVCNAAGGDLNNIVKLNIYLTDLSNFATINEIMAEYFNKPYPARAAIGANELPKAAQIEIDGIMAINLEK